MGQTTSAHEHSVYTRFWSQRKVEQTISFFREAWSSKKVSRKAYNEFFRHSGYDLIFRDLDDDFDGWVDVKQLQLYFVLWSGASWEDKIKLLFKVVDFGHKGFLRKPEMSYLVSLVVKTLRKTANLDYEYTQVESLRQLQAEISSNAFGNTTSMSLAAFVEWCSSSEECKALKIFVDENFVKPLPKEVESNLQDSVRKLAYVLEDQTLQARRLLLKYEAVSAEPVEGQSRQMISQRCGTLVDSLEKAIAVEQQELHELSQLLSTSGETLLTNKVDRVHVLQLLRGLEVLQSSIDADMEEANTVLDNLTELTYSNPGMENHLQAMQLKLKLSQSQKSPRAALGGGQREVENPICVAGRAEEFIGTDGPEVQVAIPEPLFENSLIMKDTMRRCPPMTGGQTENKQSDDEGPKHRACVAIDDFDPLEGYEGQMLTLRKGEKILLAGQDGSHGWWYGIKQNGSEGWLSPEYVEIVDTV
eukprot:GHVQ01027299.1.p1 GENE.GHVQ01027299.1~~GHVQ01027299.1.p1  ORF type:complete len:474 (-),score=64.00 GHVQ01027299.1:717-2138(-)